MNSTILLQIPQFILNIIFIPIFIYFQNAEVSDYHSQSIFTLNYASIILVLNFLHIYFCYHNWSSKIKMKGETKLNERNSENECRRSSHQVETELLERSKSKDEKEEGGESAEISNHRGINALFYNILHIIRW